MLNLIVRNINRAKAQYHRPERSGHPPLRRAVAVDNKAQQQYALVTELKRHSCHVHNKLRERQGAIKDLYSHIDELSRNEFKRIQCEHTPQSLRIRV